MQSLSKDYRRLFHDLLSQEDVQGVMLFSLEGDLLFKEFIAPPYQEPETRQWWAYFMDSLDGAREADLIFEERRIYIRKTELGYLLVLMGLLTPMAMVRLKCDVLLPSVRQTERNKGLRGFFSKRK